jgi:hypothetical protein
VKDGFVVRIRAVLDRLNRTSGFVILPVLAASYVLFGHPSVSELLQFGTVFGVVALVVSFRHLRDEEGGDRALVLSLLAIAVLGTVAYVTVSSLHSWQWVGGIVGLVAIPLVVKGFLWFVDNLGERDRLRDDVWQDRPRY